MYKDLHRHVVVSAWGGAYSHFDEAALTQAAFEDKDLFPEAIQVAPQVEAAAFIFHAEEKIFTPNSLSALLALEKAWQRAGLSPLRNHLLKRTPKVRHPSTAIVVGSSLGSIDAIHMAFNHSDAKVTPYTLSRLRGNGIAAPLAIRFGLGAGDFVLSAASATGGQALCMAGHLIQMGMASQVAVVCVDAIHSENTQRALNAIGATAKSEYSRPLMASRTGMRPISAAVAMILETKESAARRRHTPLAHWVGGGIQNECYHMLAPHPKGQVLQDVVHDTLKKTNRKISDIDWLSMHATGTKVWDKIEANVINTLFKQKKPHISAFKRTFGHTLGAAGVLEAAMLAEGLSARKLPKFPENIDTALSLAPTPRSSAQHAMSFGIGLGGTVAVNLFETL